MDCGSGTETTAPKSRKDEFGKLRGVASKGKLRGVKLRGVASKYFNILTQLRSRTQNGPELNSVNLPTGTRPNLTTYYTWFTYSTCPRSLGRDLAGAVRSCLEHRASIQE